MIESFTNSSLTTFRSCPQKFNLRYNHKLELAEEEESEALTVGSVWHRAFDVAHGGKDPFQAIYRHAPSDLWGVKLARMYAAYHWYWQDQPINVVESESTFSVRYGSWVLAGQRDGVVTSDDGRIGVLERKTTGFDISQTSEYWNKLRMDSQVGIYSVTMDPIPSFILYDVVRKPTISPRKIAKKEIDRMNGEVRVNGTAKYFSESIVPSELEMAIEFGRETDLMYGARLTSDIGDRPGHYFQRREVARTTGDYNALLGNLVAQIEAIESDDVSGSYYRNPDACHVFGRCAYFALCSNNISVNGGSVPDGYVRREHLHPELH